MTMHAARPLPQDRRAAIRRTVWIFACIAVVIYAGMLWRGFSG